jgi:hypothetical protein
MKKVLPFVKAVCLAVCLALLLGRAALLGQKRATAASVDAARQFLASLTPEQRAKATFAFDDQHRVTWFFVPMARKGLTLKEMTPPQRQKAEALLQTAVTAKGLAQIHHIQNDLEPVLKAMEAANNPNNRDPELYYFSVFGTPGGNDPWGWRVEGHHVSLNITAVNGVMTAWTPDFRGSNPAEVMQGPLQGLRVLASEEDTGFALLHALDAQQKQTAVLQIAAPREIVTGNQHRVEPLTPEGLPAGRMTAAQKKLLRNIIDAYGSRMVDEIAAERMRRIDAAGFDRITFAWAGADALHEGHYYRVQGPTFLIEFDNTQNNANHIHSVWRDFNGDFGEDVLKEHYAAVAH